ncbi:MAG: nicotinate-nucleotide adenylyltransferase [Candidatus Ratteibacteria bacterium]|nr:nicotinate-nucleotide adenylyltransferase [Candidatus Ratteibacteria bacterium]
MKKKCAIGIFGGTFNPIHNVHLEMAKLAKKKLDLKKVIFVPAARPPHKKIEEKVTPEERYRMTCLAVIPWAGFCVSDEELKQPGKSYSVKTVESFKGKFGPGAEIFFIIGSDSLTELFTWRKIDRLLRLCKFIVFRRPNFPIKSPMKHLKDKLEIIPMLPQKISSTEIRKMIKNGRSISRFVPATVERFIQKRKLYRAS